MGSHLLGTLISAVISALLFWEGVRCNNPGYSLNVSSPVTVQEGLCVTIPCTFTYDASHDEPSAPLYGYWFVEIQGERHLVATNNPKRVNEIDLIWPRFEMSGPKLNQGDCSLTILQAEAGDNNTVYFFRVEKGSRARYDYNQEGRKVSLIVTERKLDITFSESLRAGHEARIACTAQWCPSSGQPTITLTGFSEGHTKVAVIGSVVDSSSKSLIVEVIPSATDHQRNMTCTATYNESANLIPVKRTVTLNVSYAPRMFQFSGNVIHCGSAVEEFKTYTQIVAKEGDSLRVRCKTDSNPGGTERWVKTPRLSTTQSLTSDDTLQIVDLTLHDKGKYTCRAENREGSTEGVFYLQIPHSPIPCNLVDPICRREEGGYKCNCSVCSYPSSAIEWQVNGEIYKGNATSQELEVTSSNKTEEEAFSILHLRGEWKENTSVICLGSNPKGRLPIKYRLLDNSNHKGSSLSLISGVTGALIMFAVVMFIVTLAVTCQNCRKEKKLMINPESYTNNSNFVHTEKVQDDEGSCATVLSLEEIKDSSKEPKQTAGVPDPNPQEDNLFYSSIEFTLTRSTLEMTSEETETEYANIKSS